MPYIGNDLATQFQAFATQTITGDGSTGYTLDRAVANGKELLVYINNVKQEEGSGKSYTATGTTITFSEAVASGDSCYLVYMGSAQQTVNPPDASVGSSQISSADLVLPKTVTIGSAGAEDTKLVFDGNAQDYHVGLDDSADKLTVGVGSTLGTNTAMSIDSTGRVLTPARPCFSAYRNTSSGTYYDSGDLVFDATTVNVGSCYDTSTGRFTAPITGAYNLSCVVGVIYDDNSGSKFASNDWVTLQLRKNGSGGLLSPSLGMSLSAAFEAGMALSHVFQLDATDYVLVHIRSNDTDSGDGGFAYNSSSGYMHFSGFLIG